MDSGEIQKLLSQETDWTIGFAPKLFMAALVVFIGFFLVKKIGKVLNLTLDKAKLQKEISDFLGSVIDIVLNLTVVLIAAGILGVGLTALKGLLAAAGFAVGLALQGFLGNFASGLTILFFKP